jgi:Cu-processing system permease protein
VRDRALVVASATFREAVRDRVLFVVVAFAVALVLGSRVLGWLSVEDELKMVQDFSLSALSLLALLLAMLVGAGSLAREVERRTVYSVLTRDCSRGEFVLGKFAGLVATFWLCVAGAAALLVVWVVLWRALDAEGAVSALPTGPEAAALVAAVTGLLLETLVLTSVALFLGALTAPAIAAVGTAAFYASAHATEALRDLTANNLGPGQRGWFHELFEVLYVVLPNLWNVNFINQTTSLGTVAWDRLALGAVSALCWTVVFLASAAMLFGRRQF